MLATDHDLKFNSRPWSFIEASVNKHSEVGQPKRKLPIMTKHPASKSGHEGNPKTLKDICLFVLDKRSTLKTMRPILSRDLKL